VNLRKKTRVLVPLGRAPGARSSIFKRSLIFFLKFIVGPPLILVGKLLSLCFGWCFSWSNKSIALKNQRQFAEELQNNLQFLFTDHGAKVVANDAEVPFPPGFDGAYVTVATEAFRFQFIRGRGDFTVRVAPLSAPTEWEDLELVVSAIPNLPIQVEQRDFYYLCSLARILPDLYQPVSDALVGTRAEATLDEAANVHNKRMEEYVAGLKQNGVVPKILG
jgi:hypothetical protein